MTPHDILPEFYAHVENACVSIQATRELDLNDISAAASTEWTLLRREQLLTATALILFIRSHGGDVLRCLSQFTP